VVLASVSIAADNIAIVNLLIFVVPFFGFYYGAATARRTWSPSGGHFVASQKKRGTAAFRPRLSEGLAVLLFLETR